MASCNIGPDGEVPKTDANGEYKHSGDELKDSTKATAPGTPTHFQVNLEGTEIQSFKGIKATGDYISESQKNALKTEGKSFESFPGLPFDGRGDFFRNEDNLLVGQLSIFNGSTSFPFVISSLNLYTDLDSVFFNPVDFFSGDAIASGLLALDVIAATGNTHIPVAGFESDATLAFSAALSELSGYLLLVGTARALLPDDTLGPEFSFALASRPVTEPGTLGACALGLLVLTLVGRRARGKRGQASLRGE